MFKTITYKTVFMLSNFLQLQTIFYKHNGEKQAKDAFIDSCIFMRAFPLGGGSTLRRFQITSWSKAISDGSIGSRTGLLPIGPIASNQALRRRGSRATPANLRKLTVSIETAYIVPALGPQYFLSVRLMANENQRELRGFQHPHSS